MKSTKNFNATYTMNNGVVIKNRLAVAPMTHWASVPENGKLTDEERAFLKDRATGFGMFITAATLVSEEGRSFLGEPFAVSEKDIPDLKERADIIKAQGAKAILQIHHGGANIMQPPAEGFTAVAPDAHPEEGIAKATEEDIQHIIKAFGHATALAIEAGFDGIEIHAANGFIVQQFYSAETNHRTDEWGGTREKRMRFALAVLDSCIAAKKASGHNEFIIGYRFSPEEPGEHGLTMEDTYALLDEVAKRDLQYLHVSLHDFYAKARRGADPTRERIALLHEHLKGRVPLMGVGALSTGEQVEAAFATGNAEFVALASAVLINPLMGELLTEGRFDEIETDLLAEKKAKYRFPEALWQMAVDKSEFLPSVKD